MSRIWSKHTDGTWKDHPLGAEPVQLTPDCPLPLAAREQMSAVSGPVLMPRHDSLGDERWVLICQAGSRTLVNGLPVVSGARVLADRDQLDPARRNVDQHITGCARHHDLVSVRR